MFFQYILKENESSLLYQFLNAQMLDPLKGDWWITVRRDLEDLTPDLSLHDIRSMSKDRFKTLIHKTVRSRAFAWLMDKQSQSKKIKDISYADLELQNYLAQPLLRTDQTKFLFAARGKMLFLRANYPNIEDDKFCPLCTTEVKKVLDTQEHLLDCNKLNMNSTELIEPCTDYSDLFSDNVAKQKKIAVILESRYTLRKRLESIKATKELQPGQP